MDYQVETAVSHANTLLTQLDESRRLCPYAFAGLELDEQLAALRAVLQSPQFYEHMADLRRTTMSQVQDTLTTHSA